VLYTLCALRRKFSLTCRVQVTSDAPLKAFNTLLKERTKTMNNKIKLHILGVPINNLGNSAQGHYIPLPGLQRTNEQRASITCPIHEECMRFI